MSVRGFVSHLDLNVTDPSVSIEFYDKLLVRLGFERTELDRPDRASWRLDAEVGPHFEIEVRAPEARRRRHGTFEVTRESTTWLSMQSPRQR